MHLRGPASWPIVSRFAALLAVAAVMSGCGSTAPKKPSASVSPFTVAEKSSVDPGSSIPSVPAAGFTLTDQFGQKVSLSDYRGKVIMLAFVDSHCTTICPLTTASMVQALQLLGPSASEVAMLGVNANPQFLGVPSVAQYSALHGLTNRWRFVTGSLPELETVWKAYGVDVQILKGAIDHTPALYVIDQRGRERFIFLTSSSYGVVPLEADVLARRIASLLPGHPAVSRSAVPKGPAFPTPADPVNLPALVKGSASALVHLGPGSPRLVAFFASWAPNIVQELKALNTYAAQAKTAGLPPVVAVDVGPVESNASDAVDAAKSASATYPIALDTSGRTADAYAVTDIPWFVAVNAKGKIVWSHDGWLPVAQIEQQLKTALSSR